jgi:hypothetical protein
MRGLSTRLWRSSSEPEQSLNLLVRLWRLTRSRKFKQETTACQVHRDSGTDWNGAGPTHFHHSVVLGFFFAFEGI